MPEAVQWSSEARADILAIDRDTALRLFKALDRYMKTGVGNVKQLEMFSPPVYRLRAGDWRIIFRRAGSDSIEVIRARNRRDAYR